MRDEDGGECRRAISEIRVEAKHDEIAHLNEQS